MGEGEAARFTLPLTIAGDGEMIYRLSVSVPGSISLPLSLPVVVLRLAGPQVVVDGAGSADPKAAWCHSAGQDGYLSQLLCALHPFALPYCSYLTTHFSFSAPQSHPASFLHRTTTALLVIVNGIHDGDEATDIL